LLEEDRSGLKKYKIIKVSNRFDEHEADYSLDYVRIKALALKEKQLNAIQDWMAEKIEDTYVNVNRDSRACDFKNGWLKKL
jgi:peptidyl-prolyl cis-trans isomerase SurA